MHSRRSPLKGASPVQYRHTNVDGNLVDISSIHERVASDDRKFHHPHFSYANYQKQRSNQQSPSNHLRDSEGYIQTTVRGSMAGAEQDQNGADIFVFNTNAMQESLASQQDGSPLTRNVQQYGKNDSKGNTEPYIQSHKPSNRETR